MKKYIPDGLALFRIFSAPVILYLLLLDGSSEVSMNNSGEALKAYLKYNNVEASNILVIHDDIDLGFGRLRLKSGSSDGGHNGIKSINSYLQSNEYFRLKVGVGRPPKEVLSLIHI